MIQLIKSKIANYPPLARMRAFFHTHILRHFSGGSFGAFQIWGSSAIGRQSNVIKALSAVMHDYKRGGGGVDTDNNNIKIFSFGCSTGEECVDLKKALPNASVFGVDVYAPRIQKAKKKYGNLGILFTQTGDTVIDTWKPFDVVIAKSVFVRHPEAVDRQNISDLLAFCDFEKNLEKLVDMLAPGGYLVIYNANYRVIDTSIMNRVQAMSIEGLCQPLEVPVFGPDGMRLADQQVGEIFFRKVA